MAVLSWHNPLEIAQDYATLDILSEGRLNFGVGRGGAKHEFDGYGVDWESSMERYIEALEVVLKAWEGKPFSWDSKFFKFPELYVNPVPVQKPHPPLWQPTLTPASMAAVVPRNITPIVGASFSSKERIKENFDSMDYYNQACFYSIASSTGGGDGSDASDLENEYRDKAVEALGRSIELGFENLAHIRKDPDLDPIRDHPGFKAILDEEDKVDEERESKVSPGR